MADDQNKSSRLQLIHNAVTYIQASQSPEQQFQLGHGPNCQCKSPIVFRDGHFEYAQALLLALMNEIRKHRCNEDVTYNVYASSGHIRLIGLNHYFSIGLIAALEYLRLEVHSRKPVIVGPPTRTHYHGVKCDYADPKLTGLIVATINILLDAALAVPSASGIIYAPELLQL